MNKKNAKGWLKHWDFILVDILCLQISFLLGYWVVHGFANPYQVIAFRYQLRLLFFSQLVVISFLGNYTGILRRKAFEELFAVIRYMLIMFLLVVLYLFLVHNSTIASRLQMGFTSLFFVLLAFLLRQANKRRIRLSSAGDKNKKSLVLFTSSHLVSEALEKLYDDTDGYRDFKVSRIVLLDDGEPEGELSVPVLRISDEVIREIGHDWVDEAFILQPDDMLFPSQLMDDLMTMGITVNYTMSAVNDDRRPITEVRKLGRYRVVTNAVRFADGGQLAVKRLMDIIGGAIGCVLTGIVFIFVAPAIYLADPGPIFFAQKRIGQNGKVITIHKFRSMYMDAEARKAELMAQNKIKDGFMFKMEDDPRIIGSEKKDKNGRPKGIGNFIRNTSLDEFPQFYDCLIGNLSLVGWRPCTLGEWEKYGLKHRIRASMKPGITGMWQVSGRSEITDFDEVVRLDRKYLEDWSLLLDLKILLKTVVVVLTGHGAE